MLSSSFSVFLVYLVLPHSRAGYLSHNSDVLTTTVPNITESTAPETTAFPPFIIDLFEPLTTNSLALYSQLTTDNSASPVNNFFFSPLNTMSALLLAYEGTARALDFGTGDNIRLAFIRHAWFHGFSADADFPYISTLFRQGPLVNGSPAYELYVANRAYVSSSLAVTEVYKSTISTTLNSTVGQASFDSNAQDARNEINDWVRINTDNKVVNLIPDASAFSSKAMVITNALYFKPGWISNFNRTLTRNIPFHNLDDSTSQVLTMQKVNETMLYFDNLHGNLVDVPPFEMMSVPMKGDQFEFLVFLPRERDGLSNLETTLFNQSSNFGEFSVKSVLAAATNRTVARFRLPKFSIKSTFNPRAAFNGIGITLVFEPYQANLTRVTKNRDRLFLSRIYSQTIIEVDEGGSEVSGGSNGLTDDASMISPAPVSFVADHPFLFAIVDKQTKITVFLGRVTQL